MKRFYIKGRRIVLPKKQLIFPRGSSTLAIQVQRILAQEGVLL